MNQFIKEISPDILAILPVGLLLTDSAGNCMYANSAFEKLAGVESGQSLGKGWLQHLSQEDQKKSTGVTTGKAFEVGFVSFSETTYVRLTPAETADGLYCLTAENITEQRQTFATKGRAMKEDANRQQKMMQKMMDCTEAILYSVDEHGKITAFNHAASQAVQSRKGVSINVGDYWADIVSGESGLEKERMVMLLNHVLSGNSYKTVEDMLIAGGEAITYIVQASPIADEQKHIIGAVLCAHDITIRTRLQKEATEKTLLRNQELERWNQFYDTLLAVLAHDLRQPLAAIIMGADLVSYTKKELSAEELKVIMGNLRNTCKKSIELLQGLLYWVKSKKEDFSYKPEPFDLYGLINEANALFALDQQKKRIVLKNEISAGQTLHAHYQMTLFICRNLISNATKYAPVNSVIQIRSTIEEGKIILSVQDTGKGMSTEQLTRLFSINESGTDIDGIKGAGMALTIAYDMIKQMYGDIQVESIPGEGTTFYLSLPADPVHL